MTNSISEVEHYDVLFIIGSNTTEAHPIIGGKMKRAARRGAKLIVADPRHIELVDYAGRVAAADPRHRCRPRQRHDEHDHQRGLGRPGVHRQAMRELRRSWEVVKRYTPDVVGRASPASPRIRSARRAELYAKTAKAGIFYTLGITEHTTGTANVMNLANLAHGHRARGYATRRASTRCAARTTCREPATWAPCPTCTPATAT